MSMLTISSTMLTLVGDMNKPIYRYLADKKWRSFQRLITLQRLNQLGVVPDVLPNFEPTAEVRMAFRTRNVQPGDFVDSRVSEVPPRLKVQVFDKGERLVTVVVVDSDVPDLKSDNFSSRCHYLASNIPISPTSTSLPLSKASTSQLVHPWLPAFVQNGSPYHRYSVLVLEQAPGQTLDVAALQSKIVRDGFKVRTFTQQHNLKPIGASIFRGIWDEGTAGVMERHGIEGANVQFKRFRIPALKPKEKARGWEARHASAKYNLKSFRR
jgi:large subunit ribosomal protein L35